MKLKCAGVQGGCELMMGAQERPIIEWLKIVTCMLLLALKCVLYRVSVAFPS